MTFDSSKLSPAPWQLFGEGRAPDGCYTISALHAETRTWPRIVSVRSHGSGLEFDETNAAFIALARNAFDVMMRRGWYPICDSEKWYVDGEGAGIVRDKFSIAWPVWSDPFTALVEADCWMSEQENLPPRTFEEAHGPSQQPPAKEQK